MAQYLKNTFQPRFLKNVFALALPIALQNLISAAVNMADIVMIGRLGDDVIAAVGAANQVFFVLTLILFGVNSGSAIFISQFWGTRDARNVQRTMGLMLIVGLGVSLLFTLATTLIPHVLIGFYVSDPHVVALGADYLKIVGYSYIVTAFSFILSTACRCVGQVKLPMATSIFSVLLNVLGNAVLIFGLLGAPRLGLRGAALATALARYAEFAALVFFVYKLRLPIAARFKAYFSLDWPFVRRYLRTAAPVIVNEALWSLGTTLYSVAYGMLGTQALAAVQINSAVFQLFNVLLRGISEACAIMLGNRIGAGKEEEAQDYAKRFLALQPLAAVAFSALLVAARPLILSLYNITPQTLAFANTLLALQAVVMIPKALNMLIIVGICRSGGDTVFACVLDTAIVWLVAVPLAFLGVYMGFALWGVYLCVCSEEVVKAAVGIPRVLSKKWIHNVVAAIQKGQTAG